MGCICLWVRFQRQVHYCALVWVAIVCVECPHACESVFVHLFLCLNVCNACVCVYMLVCSSKINEIVCFTPNTYGLLIRTEQ